jgi:hypothetical protein
VDRQGIDELVEIMRRMALGDDAAIVTLYERFRRPIAAAVARVVAERPVRLCGDEIESLALEVCFELAKVAGGWSPAGGALPWVWARHRVANVVDRELGQRCEPLDDTRVAALDAAEVAGSAAIRHEGGVDGLPLWETLGGIAPDHASLRLLCEALDRTCVSDRDRELWLHYECEKAAGNPSPAATVSPLFGMKEPTVRQAARRVRQRLRQLATTDARFAPLIDLPVLA